MLLDSVSALIFINLDKNPIIFLRFSPLHIRSTMGAPNLAVSPIESLGGNIKKYFSRAKYILRMPGVGVAFGSFLRLEILLRQKIMSSAFLVASLRYSLNFFTSASFTVSL